MFTERNIVGKIEILEDGLIQLREDTIIERDGVEIHRVYHRRVREPGENTRDFEPRLKSIADLIWTPEVVAEYKTKKLANTSIV